MELQRAKHLMENGSKERKKIMSKSWTAKELEAKAMIERFGAAQRKAHYACPRCGEDNMDDEIMRNALSRYANIQVCNACGTDEAIRDVAGNILPLSKWAICENPGAYIQSPKSK